MPSCADISNTASNAGATKPHRIAKKAKRSRKNTLRLRGSFDFECWEWVNPRACGLRWGSPGARKWEFVFDKASTKPKNVAINTLQLMAMQPDGVREWWGHNAGKYDSLFLLEAIQALKWKASAFIAGGRIIALKVNANGKRFTIHDSYAVVQSKLSKAAESFELKARKLLTDDDYSVDVRNWSETRIEEGCLADCECVLELLERVESLFEEYGGSLKTTFSSSALTVVASKTPLLDMRALTEVNMIARTAFHGGRVEVFKHTPQGRISEWDINSSYPHSMAKALPWKYLGERKTFNEDTQGTVDVTVETSSLVDMVPILPYLEPSCFGLVYPVGSWRARFAIPELIYAIRNGVRVRRIHSLQHFTSETPFASFVSEIYSRKQQAKGAAREFFKLVLNGCYGKFAQKPERETLTIFGSENEANTFAWKNADKVKFLNGNDSRFLTVTSHRWPKQTHYALASTITAYSRISLHERLSKATGLCYCDTDSIHATSYSGDDCNTSLGALKLERENFTAVYAAPKLYRVGEHYAAKGFPVSKETFEKLINGDVDEKGKPIAGKVSVERMQLAKAQARSNTKEVVRKIDTKSWAGLSTKRKPLYDNEGNTVPWSITELEKGAHLKAASPLAKWLRKTL